MRGYAWGTAWRRSWAGVAACAAMVAVLMVGCSTPGPREVPQLGLEAFPPVANDKAPGASQQAWETAKAMGRGVNFGNMFDAPDEGLWGIKAEPEFIDAVVAAGFRTVRLPVRWSNHCGNAPPFTLEPAFADRVEQVVDALLARGLYVVMDMHHDRPFEGAKPDPGERAADPQRVDERFLRLWVQVAERFKGKSDKLLFEVYNEPHGRLHAERWNDLLARAMGVIRASNPDRVVVISGAAWGGVWALHQLRVPNDPHLLVSFHHYEPMDFTHQGADWHPEYAVGVTCCDAGQAKKVAQAFEVAKAWSDKRRYPLFLGEFGSHDKAEMASRETYTRLMREHAERHGMPWAVWEFGSSFGVYDRQAKAYHQGLMKALMPTWGQSESLTAKSP